jgi:hypothetical protein
VVGTRLGGLLIKRVQTVPFGGWQRPALMLRAVANQSAKESAGRSQMRVEADVRENRRRFLEGV